MQRFLQILALMLGVGSVVSCEKGAPLVNRPPDTRIFVDAINLDSANRLNTVVRLHWLGTDQDGYVEGYEISIDEGEWGYTTATDSVFRFDLGAASDPFGVIDSTADILFQVRAIDNLGARDESPDVLVVPIKNTKPTAGFDSVLTLPDTVAIVGSISWNVSDVDGVETLDSVYLRINDGPWRNFAPTVDFVTFQPMDATLSGPQAAELFTGAEATRQTEPLPGLLVDGDNYLYLRARDVSGSFSEVDTLGPFFLQGRSSDLLVVAEHGNVAAIDRYRELLDATVDSYDWYDLQSRLPNFWEPTFSLFLRSYDQVFWFSDGVPNEGEGEQLLLSVAGPTLQHHLNDGGKLLITTSFPGEYNTPEIVNSSLIFDYSPLDSLSASSGQARVPTGSKISPLGEWVGRLDTLVASGFITSADPFYTSGVNVDLMKAEITAIGGWQGPSVVAARTRFNNGRTNQVFFSLELYRLDGDPAALESLFDVIFNEEFAW